MRECERYQEIFIDAIDGTLDDNSMSELLLHLEKCRDCRLLFFDMKNIVEETSSISQEVPEELHKNITDAVKWQAKGDRMRKRTRRLGLAAACAVLVITGVGLASMGGLSVSEDSAQEFVAEESKCYSSGLTSSEISDEGYFKSEMDDTLVENDEETVQDSHIENPQYNGMPAESESTKSDDMLAQEEYAARIKANIKDESALGKAALYVVSLKDGRTAYVISFEEYKRLAENEALEDIELISGDIQKNRGNILVIERK